MNFNVEINTHINSTKLKDLHSLDLFTQMIIFNVVINSDMSALVILLFVHNFTKLTGSIFKKFEQKQYFMLTTLGLYIPLKIKYKNIDGKKIGGKGAFYYNFC